MEGRGGEGRAPGRPRASDRIEFKHSGTARAVQPAVATLFTIWLCLLPLSLFVFPGLAFLISLLAALVAYLASTIVFSRYQYCILPDRLLLRNGVISSNYLDISMIRVQSVIMDRTYIERMLGLGSLRIQTAGFFDADAWIYSIKDYDALGNYILERSEEARLSRNLPRMARAAPDPETIRALDEVRAGIEGLLGTSSEKLRPLSKEVMNRRFRMSPKMVTVWTIETFLGLLVPWCCLWSVLLLFPIATCVVSMAALLGVMLVASRTYAVLNFENYTFHFDQDALTVRHGILMKTRVKMPYKRIQNINVLTSFFGRMWRLHSVHVETASGDAHIHGIEDPDPVVYFLLEQAEDARFDDALGDATELEDYHLKILKQVKKVNYRLRERLGDFDNPFDRRAPGFRGSQVMEPRTRDYLVARTELEFLVGALGVAFLAGLAAFLLSTEVPLPPAIAGFCLAAGLVLLALYYIVTASYSRWYGPRLFESYLLRFDHDSLFSRAGVWTITDAMIPYRRIQNAYIEEGILSRYFGIKIVFVHAPGMTDSIPGVRHPERLVGFLLRKAEEARVDEAQEEGADIVSEIARELRTTRDLLQGYLAARKPAGH